MTPPPSPTILIADDEIYMLRLLEMTLKKGGFTVVSCQDGQQAITLATSQKPRLIVLDMLMPGLDGLAALRCLKSNPATSEIPVVVLSAKGHALTKFEADLAGAAIFIPKPFSPNQLLNEVKRILAEIPGPGTPPPQPS